MNVLILTPDRVGSTLLQRLVTIYMLRKGFDKPVINLHELTNGLEKYYNTILNQEVLGKPTGTEWGYYQKLNKIEELLKSVDHYKTSRLAHYHIVNRKDSIEEQIKFYEYLNRNFYIISCRRDNLFEHALSWGINAHSKKLNVYSFNEKINTFENIYKNGIELSKIGLFKYLENYKKYIEWSDRYFNVQSYFNYDTDVHRIEDYILNLDFMKGNKNNTWQDMFGQTFDTWNLCHKLLPDVKLYDHTSTGVVPLRLVDPSKEQRYNLLKGSDWPEFTDLATTHLQDNIKTEIEQFNFESYNVKTTQEIADFFKETLPLYSNISNQLNKLVDDGFLVSSVPIKLQTLSEKTKIVKNISQCIGWYNEWVDKNNFGIKYTEFELQNIACSENVKFSTTLKTQSQLKLN